MKLHNYYRSSASFRVRIALALKGLTYDYVPVNLAQAQQQTRTYTTLAANKLVPLLEVDGRYLSQSLAIIEYLDETHPTPALLPADALGRAQVRALAQSIACEIQPLHNLRVLKYLQEELIVNEDEKTEWCRYWCLEGLRSLERQLQQLPKSLYCYGDTPTLADCCLVPQIFSARRFYVDLSGLPRTMDVFEQCMMLHAFAGSQPSACPDNE